MAKSKRQRHPQTAPSAARVASRPAGAANGGATDGGAADTDGAAVKLAEKPATAPSRLTEIRARAAANGGRAAPRPQNRRRYAPVQPWWRRNLLALGSVAGVIIIIVGFYFAAQHRNNVAAVGIGDAAPQSVLTALSGVTAKTEAAVGTGGIADGFEPTPPNTTLLTSKGLPEVIYVGAEYCPYCAAERWSTIIALNHFGSFKGLTLMKSSAGDIYPNTATFSFKGATYTSKYLVFNATETEDRNQQQLDTPPSEALQAFSTYDTTPYTKQQGGIPFVSYGNQFVTTAGPYQPTMLQNLTWQQIAAQLNNPNNAATKAIVGTANYQTAAICKITKDQPGSVCKAANIQQIEASLPTP